jgi:hypothetical protein
MLEGKFFSSWLKSIGRSRSTGFRWEQQGRIKTLRIYGRKFITKEEIDRFFKEGAQHKNNGLPRSRKHWNLHS